jgi:hypothetical protein
MDCGTFSRHSAKSINTTHQYDLLETLDLNFGGLCCDFGAWSFEPLEHEGIFLYVPIMTLNQSCKGPP